VGYQRSFGSSGVGRQRCRRDDLLQREGEDQREEMREGGCIENVGGYMSDDMNSPSLCKYGHRVLLPQYTFQMKEAHDTSLASVCRQSVGGGG
jgi:hypothetical protein